MHGGHDTPTNDGDGHGFPTGMQADRYKDQHHASLQQDQGGGSSYSGECSASMSPHSSNPIPFETARGTGLGSETTSVTTVSETTVHTTTPPTQTMSTLKEGIIASTYTSRPAGTVLDSYPLAVSSSDTMAVTWTGQNQRVREETQVPIRVSPRLREMWDSTNVVTTTNNIHQPDNGQQRSYHPGFRHPLMTSSIVEESPIHKLMQMQAMHQDTLKTPCVGKHCSTNYK